MLAARKVRTWRGGGAVFELAALVPFMRSGVRQSYNYGFSTARGERGSHMVAGTVRGSTRDDYVGTGMYDAFITDIPKWSLDSGLGSTFRLREELLLKLALGLDLQWVVDALPPTMETIKDYFPDITSDIDLSIRFDEAVREYNLARTKYFWLRSDTLDISGPTQELDQTFIDTKFKDGRNCDGPGLRRYELEKAADRVEGDLSESRKIAYRTYVLDPNTTTIESFKSDITTRFGAWKCLPECIDTPITIFFDMYLQSIPVQRSPSPMYRLSRRGSARPA